MAELPDDLAAAGQDNVTGEDENGNVAALEGVELADLDNRTRRQFDIPQRIRGALVTKWTQTRPRRKRVCDRAA